MKKIYTMLMMATMALAMTSCGIFDDDEEVAYTLEGTWKGNMYISSYWDGRTYDATYSEVTFLKDPYTYSSGQGYWVDYYTNAPWGGYVANHIDWRVDWGVIYVHFIEENTSLEIRDYRLTSNRFYGTIHDGDSDVRFELYNTSRVYYDNYNWGYDGWGFNYYWSRTRSASADSTATADKPVRFVRTAD